MIKSRDVRGPAPCFSVAQPMRSGVSWTTEANLHQTAQDHSHCRAAEWISSFGKGSVVSLWQSWFVLFSKTSLYLCFGAIID